MIKAILLINATKSTVSSLYVGFLHLRLSVMRLVDKHRKLVKLSTPIAGAGMTKLEIITCYCIIIYGAISTINIIANAIHQW